MSMNFLKCDAKNCTHVETVEVIGKEHIGKPCPECGASLLTERGYRVFRRMMFVLKPFRWLGMIKDPNPDGSIPDGYKTASFHHHAGKTTIKEID